MSANVSADRGAIESIAETLCDQLGDDDGSSPCPYDATAQRILDRLAADGYSVVKTEWECMIPIKASSLGVKYGVVKLRRQRAGEWEHVPEGSEDA